MWGYISAHISKHISVSHSAPESPAAFNSSGGMLQIPGALPFLSLDIAVRTSAKVGGSQLIDSPGSAFAAATIRSAGGEVCWRLSRSE